LREERKQELEAHVEAVNAILKDTWIPGEEADAGEGEWGGIEDDEVVVPELVDHEEEYIDEDKYTTVTVEELDVSKEGLLRVADEDESEDTLEAEVKPVEEEKKGKQWPKKPRKKKFRYESKAERKVTRGKQKAGNRARADARRGND
jgi:ribosomal RNA-processing protein 17